VRRPPAAAQTERIRLCAEADAAVAAREVAFNVAVALTGSGRAGRDASLDLLNATRDANVATTAASVATRGVDIAQCAVRDAALAAARVLDS
jgi:hypothetical protein